MNNHIKHRILNAVRTQDSPGASANIIAELGKTWAFLFINGLRLALIRFKHFIFIFFLIRSTISFVILTSYLNCKQTQHNCSCFLSDRSTTMLQTSPQLKCVDLFLLQKHSEDYMFSPYFISHLRAEL